MEWESQIKSHNSCDVLQAIERTIDDVERIDQVRNRIWERGGHARSRTIPQERKESPIWKGVSDRLKVPKKTASQEGVANVAAESELAKKKERKRGFSKDSPKLGILEKESKMSRD